MKKSKTVLKSGFTIVELLVVIVVIGILVAITIISYAGIAKKANEASIQSEITNASKKLSMYYAEYGSYPTEVGFNQGTNWCPTQPNSNTNYCIKFNPDTVVVYTSGSSSYDLTFTRSGLTYKVSNGGSPLSVTQTPTTPIIGITGSTGIAQVGQTLTAGILTPAGATANYQWKNSTNGVSFTDISGATSSSYAVGFGDIYKYLKVEATGYGNFSGNVTYGMSAKVPAPAWITVGSQIWAGSNLNTGVRVNGTVEQTDNSIVEKYCYGNSEANCASYGALYQWSEAMGYSIVEGSQGICPVGSHIPSDNDWSILITYLGGYGVAGEKLKMYGVSALNVPYGGYRDYSDGSFQELSRASLWTSTPYDWDYGYVKYTTFQTGWSNVNKDPTDANKNGYSIRCIKN